MTKEQLENYFEYLDGLRSEGHVNMFGASANLVHEFPIDMREGKKVLAVWIKTFNEEDSLGKRAEAGLVEWART